MKEFTDRELNIMYWTAIITFILTVIFVKTVQTLLK